VCVRQEARLIDTDWTRALQMDLLTYLLARGHWRSTNMFGNCPGRVIYHGEMSGWIYSFVWGCEDRVSDGLIFHGVNVRWEFAGGIVRDGRPDAGVRLQVSMSSGYDLNHSDYTQTAFGQLYAVS